MCDSHDKYIYKGSVPSFEPTPNIILTHPDGRKAIIDFGGEKVTFSGDLPIDEAAHTFFVAVGELLLNALKAKKP